MSQKSSKEESDLRGRKWSGKLELPVAIGHTCVCVFFFLLERGSAEGTESHGGGAPRRRRRLLLLLLRRRLRRVSPSLCVEFVITAVRTPSSSSFISFIIK